MHTQQMKHITQIANFPVLRRDGPGGAYFK